MYYCSFICQVLPIFAIFAIEKMSPPKPQVAPPHLDPISEFLRHWFFLVFLVFLGFFLFLAVEAFIGYYDYQKPKNLEQKPTKKNNKKRILRNVWAYENQFSKRFKIPKSWGNIPKMHVEVACFQGSFSMIFQSCMCLNRPFQKHIAKR